MSLREDLRYGMGVFKGLGISEKTAHGIMGSLMGESGRGLKTDAFNPKDPNGGSQGIAQWHSGRLTGLKNFAKSKGTSWKDRRTQFDYIAKELKTSHKGVLKELQGVDNLKKGENIWTRKFEVPAASARHHSRRQANAVYASNLLSGAQIDPVDVDESLTGATNVSGAVTGYAEEPEGIAEKAAEPFQAILGVIDKQIDKAFGTPGRAVKTAGKVVGGPLGSLFGAIGDEIDPANMTPQEQAAHATKLANQSFFGEMFDETKLGGKVGALAGGVFGGPVGSMIGAVLGQGISTMLDRSAAERQFPEAPSGGTRGGGGDRSSWNDLGSKQARDAIDSGSTGLW